MAILTKTFASKIAGVFVCLIVITGFWCSALFAAQASFYTLGNRFEKGGAPPKPKAAAVEESLSGALLSSQPASMTGFPSAPAIRKTLQEITQGGSSIEIEQGQSLYAKGAAIVKFIATAEGLVTIETVDKDTLRILVTGIGSTYIHVWDATGRTTFEIKAVIPKYEYSQAQKRQMEAFDKDRSFRFNYANNRTATYQGPRFRDRNRSSVDFNQNFGLNGDTPYGEFGANAVTQKSAGKTLLTDGQVTLKDGRIGPMKNFNATFGDSRVAPALMVFPGGRIRGSEIEHWDDKKQAKWLGFYGKEQSSIIGTLSPGVVTKRTPNSYLSGGVLDYKINDGAKVKVGQFFGQGRSRTDELQRAGTAGRGDFIFSKNLTGETEVDFNSQRFAHKHALTAHYDKITVRNEWRDVSKEFYTMLGAPSRQGEVGNAFEVNLAPNDQLYMSGSMDIFRDRLIFNPENPDGVNIHTDMSANYIPNAWSSWNFTYQDIDDTGRVGPTRQRSISTQYNHKFDILGHPATLFTRYMNRGNRILNSPLSNYLQNQGVVGLYVPIFWNINFSIQQEWNGLKEPNIRRFTRPKALTYNWDYNTQVWNTPLYFDSRLRIRDEEDTESPNSFMSGEDSVEISGGLSYRQYEDLEIFLTGSFAQYNPESQNTVGHRIEAQFMTGMKYIFDSQIRWSAIGAFEGFVYKDLNGDGFRQPSEPGMPGMIVEAATGQKATTDARGYYELKQIEGKTVALTLDSSKIPYGHAPTTPTRVEILIAAGKTEQVDFGLMPRSEVTGIIYNDLNGNGKYDINEPGIGKVKVQLDGSVMTARSSSNGVYGFPNVVTGDHVAALSITTLPDGYLPQDVPKRSFTLFEGIRYELNFPLRAVRTINGRVYRDDNRNGFLDKDEQVLSNVRVLLGDDLGLTDSQGYYLFDSVKKGRYLLSVDSTTIPTGYEAGPAQDLDFPADPVTMIDVNIPLKKKV